MKLLIFLTLFTISTSTLAERRIYSKNQGDKPEVFNAQYFEGQWTVNKPKIHQHAAIKDFDQRKSPITIVFTPSGVDELNEQIRYFTDIKSISHAKSSASSSADSRPTSGLAPAPNPEVFESFSRHHLQASVGERRTHDIEVALAAFFVSSGWPDSSVGRAGD